MTSRLEDLDSSSGTLVSSSESVKNELSKLVTDDLEVNVPDSLYYSSISSDNEETDILLVETIRNPLNLRKRPGQGQRKRERARAHKKLPPASKSNPICKSRVRKRRGAKKRRPNRRRRKVLRVRKEALANLLEDWQKLSFNSFVTCIFSLI